MLLSVHCSRVSPLRDEDLTLVEILEGIKQGTVLMDQFPHALFDRWDITVHEPDSVYYEGGEEPVYGGRFRLHSGGVQNAGFYSQEGSNLMNGWGYPCVDTLLMSLDVGREGSFFKSEVFVYGKDDRHNKVEVRKRVARNIGHLLTTFSNIARRFKEGVYNHEYEEPFDFEDATDAAIGVGEALTGRTSKLRPT